MKRKLYFVFAKHLRRPSLRVDFTIYVGDIHMYIIYAYIEKCTIIKENYDNIQAFLISLCFKYENRFMNIYKS